MQAADAGIWFSRRMVDMVALPLWVGVLIQHFRFDPQQSGLLVTLFLAGAVAASLLIAPLFHRLASGRMLATAGLAGGAVAFWMLASSMYTAFGVVVSVSINRYRSLTVPS